MSQGASAPPMSNRELMFEALDDARPPYNDEQNFDPIYLDEMVNAATAILDARDAQHAAALEALRKDIETRKSLTRGAIGASMEHAAELESVKRQLEAMRSDRNQGVEHAVRLMRERDADRASLVAAREALRRIATNEYAPFDLGGGRFGCMDCNAPSSHFGFAEVKHDDDCPIAIARRALSEPTPETPKETT